MAKCQAWNREKRPHDERRTQVKLLCTILLAVTPAVAAVALIVASSRPDFFFTEFAGRAASGATTIIDLPLLRSPSAMPPVLGSVVQLPGYMIPFGRTRYDEHVDAFLLVPDPGNWLHPPHLDADEVVLVQMDNGKKVPLLERKAVWVRGTISPMTRAVGKTDAEYNIHA
jgi:hypothetical protein